MRTNAVKLISLLLLLAVGLSSCGSILPESDQPGYTGDGPTEEQSAQDAEKIEDGIRALDALWSYDREEALLEKEEEIKNAEENRPLTETNAEFAELVTEDAKDRMRALLADYPSEAYKDNMDTRSLKTILNGLSGETVNGGYITDKATERSGYWRITNCVYYNSFFFTDGQDNTTRILFKASMYHYALKENENLAEATDPSELTTENSEITEYENSFLVVAIDSVSLTNLNERTLSEDQVRENVLFFENYDAAISSFTEGDLKAEEWKIPETYQMLLIDGYKGKPIVQMPELVGRYIDISTPENIKELDDLGVTNYEVKWVDNDGSLVAYSIVSCTKDPGALVDITDGSRESRITVEVAKKA